MIESTESLLPRPSSPAKPLQVLCVGNEPDSLKELRRLLETLGVLPVGDIVCHPKSVNPATYIGKGKVEATAKLAIEAEAEAIIIDFELSPNQLRNLEKAVGKPVIDRPGVIIEIFSRHAKTKEAKTQVELARLQYLLPRLAHFWTHFERQQGKGMGERQIEVDRRLVKKRMEILRGRLKQIATERKLRRSRRDTVLKVALVGYTNAGKSTLLNALTHSDVRAEDKLFATLDPSVRMLDPNSHPPVVVIDTVGFISRLPPSLVASFRSTLEEVADADLLVHVVDGSDPTAKDQLDVTEKILKELDLGDTPRMTVLNKCDQVGAGSKNLTRLIAPGSMAISALNSKDVIRLRDTVLEHFKKNFEVWEVVVPYSESKLEALLHAHGSIEKTKHLEKGTFIRLRIDPSWAKRLELEKFRT
ncbi:GTPase HflX [bacterium]|jgi:GTP-binding protein HflX|nr:GTPase HflX [bacterium]